MNHWALHLAGTTAGSVATDLTAATNRKLTFVLSGPSQVSFDLPGDHPQAAQMAELTTDVYATCNGEWLFKGRVGSSNDNLTATNHTSSFTVTDYRGMLDRRIIWPSARMAFNATEQAEIAWALIADSQAISTLGIWRIPPGGGADTLVPTGITRTMLFAPGKKIGEAISDMSLLPSGFDWAISGQGQFQLFYPRRDHYLSAPVPTLAYGREIVGCQRQLTSTIYANALYYSGASDLTPVTVSVAPGAAGRFESAIAKADIADAATLTAAANAELAADDVLTAAYGFTLAPGVWNPDALWLGDTVRFFVKAGRLQIDVNLRITGIEVDLDDGGGETVTLTFSQNPSALTAAAGLGAFGAGGLGSGFDFGNQLDNLASDLGNLGLSLPGLPDIGGGPGGSGGMVSGPCSNTNPSLTTTIDIPAPPDVAAGDTLLLCFTQDYQSASPVPPAGWTLHILGQTGLCAWVWAKTATASEPAFYTVSSIAGYGMSGLCIKMPGVTGFQPGSGVDGGNTISTSTTWGWTPPNSASQPQILFILVTAPAGTAIGPPAAGAGPPAPGSGVKYCGPSAFPTLAAFQMPITTVGALAGISGTLSPHNYWGGGSVLIQP